MMREIKFRAWDSKNKKMYSFELIELPYSENVNLDGQFDGLLDMYYKLMQYTGLKDKNGVEIYEGDIVKKSCGNYKIGKVMFLNGMFCFESIGFGIKAGSDAFTEMHSLHYKEYDSFNNYEVIGNIYENPELLERK